MGRWLAIDYGSKRIGLAVCDPTQTVASPAGMVPSRGGAAKDADLLIQWADEHEVDGFVVGMPFNMDGSIGPQARMSAALARELGSRSLRPVEIWDERLSSFQADEWLAEMDLKPHDKSGRRDSLAALAILRAFLQARSE